MSERKGAMRLHVDFARDRAVLTSNQSVFVNGKQVMRVGDWVGYDEENLTDYMATGTTTVIVENSLACKRDDQTSRGDKAEPCSTNVFFGGTKTRTAAAPLWRWEVQDDERVRATIIISPLVWHAVELSLEDFLLPDPDIIGYVAVYPKGVWVAVPSNELYGNATYRDGVSAVLTEFIGNGRPPRVSVAITHNAEAEELLNIVADQQGYQLSVTLDAPYLLTRIVPPPPPPRPPSFP